MAWLDPYPDAWLPIEEAKAESKMIEQENISLAFLASIQLLPAQQRAALILVDVLDWSAAETAQALGKSLSSVNNLLYRARKKVRERAAKRKIRQASVGSEAALLQQYLEAWSCSDAEALSRILTDDAILHMPPFPAWYAGGSAIRDVLAGQLFDPEQPDRWKVEMTGANGQPAFRLWRKDEEGDKYGPFGMMLIDFEAGKIAEIGAFLYPHWLEYFPAQ